MNLNGPRLKGSAKKVVRHGTIDGPPCVIVQVMVIMRAEYERYIAAERHVIWMDISLVEVVEATVPKGDLMRGRHPFLVLSVSDGWARLVPLTSKWSHDRIELSLTDFVQRIPNGRPTYVASDKQVVTVCESALPVSSKLHGGTVTKGCHRKLMDEFGDLGGLN